MWEHVVTLRVHAGSFEVNDPGNMHAMLNNMYSHFCPYSPTTKKMAPASSTEAAAAAAIGRMLEAGLSEGRAFCASVSWSASELTCNFNVGSSQEPVASVNRPSRTASATKTQLPANPQATRPQAAAPPSHRQAPVQPASHMPRPYTKPQPSALSHAQPVLSSGDMVTLRAHVKWIDGSKGCGVVHTDEPGHPDVFFDDATLRAGGIADARRGMPVIVTFNASHAKPRALVLQSA
jgi:cold shock CspA family protein